MVIAPRLDLRQSQTLVMTPQLQQAIKLLQLSNLDLSAYVDQELERNPLLERATPDEVPVVVERTEDRADAAAAEVLDPRPDSLSEAPLDQEFNTARDEDGPGGAALDGGAGDSGLVEAWSTAGLGLGPGSGSGAGGSGTGSAPGEGPDLLESTVAAPRSLRDHVSEQIILDLPDPTQRLIAHHLLGLLDPCGYLLTPLDEVADTLGCSVDLVERVLTRVQAMDPPGLFARSLRECLALQLADRNRLDPAMAALLDNLDLLARRDLPGLMARCAVDRADLMDMIGEIRRLDPKPGLRFDGGVIQTLVPDILMRPDPGGGGWLVDLNTETLPRVLVNNRYHARLARGAGAGDRAVKTFLSENLAAATWLVKSLDQRANTILKVATEIVRRQEAFFLHGVSHLRPLILRDIAEAVEMHESTISRVTSNKTLASPRGIFELKFFFTQAIGGADGGESHSAEAVRHRIKTLIDAEPATAPLSDEHLVKILKAEGIDIARRTVAKYREGLGLPSSVRRRADKRAALEG